MFSPSAARIAEKAGFKALYFSGAAFSGLLALPDLGMVTLPEVAKATYDISTQVRVPLIVDADTGYGEAVNVSRAVGMLKASGAAALHIEDQVMPKRCGHLEGKELVGTDEMVKKVAVAKSEAESEILVIARTDARSVEGFDSAVERALAYSKAGADMVFPEALQSASEFAEFRRRVSGPLVANMTEFGKTPYMKTSEFEELGYSIVLFPVTAFRAAMKTVEATFNRLKREGTQKEMLDSLMSREEFYDLIDYHRYEQMDRRGNDAAEALRKKQRK